MKRPIVCLFLSILLAGLTSCMDTTGPSTPGPDARASEGSTFAHEGADPGALSVLTWNVYYGADLGLLLEGGETPLPARVAQVFGQVRATDAPARAAAIAEQIAESAPHVVGLQEVAHYRIQAEGDFLDAAGGIRNPVPNATETVFDFVDLLLAALRERGLAYRQAARTTTFDVELPMFAGGACPPCSDLRLTESVAILARSDVATSAADGGLYEVNFPVTVGGFGLEIPKGWASVDVALEGRTYRVVTTHLEPADVGPGGVLVPDIHQIQLAQASELLVELSGSEVPVILTGDLNSEPDGTSTDTYALVADAGFVDTWLVGRQRGEGYTANQDATLTNAVSTLSHRIDFVLYRDAVTEDDGSYRGAVHAERLGEEQDDRTASGLWPSDHAGVLAAIRAAPRPRGTAVRRRWRCTGSPDRSDG